MSVDQGNKDVPGENLRSDNEKVDGGTTRVDSRVLPAGSDPSTQEISSPRTQRVDSNTFVPAAAPVNSPNSPSTPPQTQRVDKGDFIPAGGNRIDRPPLQTQHIAEKIVSAGSALVQAGPQHVKAGSVIQLNSGRYQILSRLGKPSGEAEVFLVELDNARYALKFYYAHIKPDQEVLSFLHSFRSPGVISLIEYGVIDGRTYELMEFAPGGSLVDTHVSGQFKYAPQKDFQRLKEFVQTLSEGLNDLHKQGILHKDIKPDNMFLSSEALQGVKIGDFGLAALVTNNSGKQITVQNRTADYAAPEIYRTLATGDDQGSVIVGKEVDFYALGITLLFLWKGANPFEGMSEFNTLHIKSEGNVVLPDDMPISLQRLVRGLITVVPKHRWGYAEIQRWLRGEHVELYEDIGVSEKMYPPLNLGDLDGTGIEVIVKSPAELAEVLLKDTQRGYQYLYQGTITDWVKSVDMPLASDMTHIISEEFSVAGVSGKAKKDRALAALNKAVYKLDPYRPFYTSGGVVCNGLIEIGEAIEKEQSYYLDAVANELDPLYLFLEARDMVSTVNTLHQHARSGSMPRPYAKEQAFNEIVLALQDWSTLRLNGKVFQSPAEMLAAPELIQVEIIQQLVEGDHSKVSLWLNRLMDQDDTWPERLATWRSLGNHTPRTLVYLLDPQSPFDFKGSTVLTTKEFLDELTKQLRALDSSQEYINASSNFVKEADFWLSYFAYSPEHTDTALDNIEFTGYAEVLSVYLTPGRTRIIGINAGKHKRKHHQHGRAAFYSAIG